MYALIDCNNFYASCERAFDPQLRNQPIAILSNNDGCVIARSDEAKTAGVAMGEPAFKLKQIFDQQEVRVLSSNYALYGDMSRRVMQTLHEITAFVEPYSIDEAFVQLGERGTASWDALGASIKEKIWRWTGIPVSVGIAPTKTLAKLANETAKANAHLQGVCSFVDDDQLDDLLAQTPVTDIWGIGRGFANRLAKNGVYSALELKQMYNRPQWVRKLLKVNGLRTVAELNGTPCLGISEMMDERKGIMTSRSFGERITDIEAMRKAVAHFVSIAAEKLRAQQSVASMLSVTLRTSKYARSAPKKYKHGCTMQFPAPTADSHTLINAAQHAAEKLFEPGLRYKKAAIMLTGLISEAEIQADLFAQHHYDESKHELMNRVDDINKKYGRRTTIFGGTGLTRDAYKMKQEHLSSRYTTRWDELMGVSSA